MATTIKAMLNTDRASRSGYYPLVVRVIHQRRKKLIYSPYRLRPQDFDSCAERVLCNDDSPWGRRLVQQMNRFIRETKKDIAESGQRLEREHRSGFTMDDLISRMRSSPARRNVFGYIDNEIAARSSAGRLGAADILMCFRRSLLKYTGDKPITFSQINYRFVYDYIDFLRSRGVCENTVHMYLRNLRAIYNKARKEGAVSARYSPFEDIKMNGTQTLKRSISREFLRRIAYMDLSESDSLERARDIFLFSFYTRGMSLVDILHLKRSDVCNGHIYYIRNKTKQHFQVKVNDRIRELIEKYAGDSEYIFPYLDAGSSVELYRQYRRSLSLININLKRVGMMAGVEIPLTTYVARHSWATLAKESGVSVTTISQGLGHTTEKTTQIYLRAFDNKIIDRANEKIIVL